jgi:hypothetical protein
LVSGEDAVFVTAAEEPVLPQAYILMQTIVVSSAESGRFSLPDEYMVKPQAKSI